MKAIALLLALTFSSFLPDGDRIIWSPDRPLEWSDFQGPPAPNSPHWASTNSGLRYMYGYKTRGDNFELTFEITAYMSPEKSWSIEEKQTDDLLRHEQLHFDIAELHARKLRRAVANYDFTADFQDEIKHIYNTILKASRDMQSRYDKDSEHSVNKKEQKNWEEKIALALKKMDKWSGHEVVSGDLGD